MIGLEGYLLLAAGLFCIGLYGVFTKRNVISVLMSVELMMNAVNINLVAFNRFLSPVKVTGHIFAIFVIVVAAAEIAVGLAIILNIYRSRTTTNVEDFNILKW
ncbi:NADH-quinone oxidoreductase subunit K [Clostridium folliculivorans]|uniref:NADH-quinone oxidoreductase subunit K n=1 Tax=Clostridium folliculivorans TaxID=2886038 RepID=A0A9W6DCJ6_9CLOT|nr:NADH-quinone oxidoreductase subunit NuoK [Clostridium folliculivorans]GKU27570.1 NADH-quinone oxidoreductase subunit K [Clostridium folliculivorans]